METHRRLSTFINISVDTPFTQEQVVKAAETIVLHSSKYQFAYRAWIAIPHIQKAYTNFKQRLEEYQIQNELNTSMTAEEGGFASANHVIKQKKKRPN